jgi:type IV pilus assembly protein PilV
MSRPTPQSAPQGGYVLLEALIAILVFSIGILAMVGMQSASARYVTDAKFRSTAGYLVSQCLGQLWGADRSTLTKSTACASATDLPELPKGSARTVTVTDDGAAGYSATVTVTWQMPGDSEVHQVSSTTVIHDRCDTVGCT